MVNGMSSMILTSTRRRRTQSPEKVALVMALRNAGKDETSHPNEFNAASLVNKIGTSNGIAKW